MNLKQRVSDLEKQISNLRMDMVTECRLKE